MGGPSKDPIRLELQKHPSVTAGSVIPLVTGTMGVSSVVDIDNTTSETTSRTRASTTCEVGQGEPVDHHK